MTTDLGADTALVFGPAARTCALISDAPQLSQAGAPVLRTTEVVDAYQDHHTVALPVERPLRVLIDDRDVGTLWTLGARPEWLVLGYLRNRELVSAVTILESISIDWSTATATVRIRERPGDDQLPPQPPGASRIGGNPSATLTPGEPRGRDGRPRGAVLRSTLLAMLEQMPQGGEIYRTAGSVHGCALYRGAELWISVEDVSRRNALDTVAGWMALHGVDGSDKVLYSTGRLTAEIILNAGRMGIACVVSRKGVTGTCVDLAAQLGMTLLGHCSRGRYVCYAGQVLFDAES